MAEVPRPGAGAIRFGEYVLDEASGALYRAGEQVRVEPKPLALLLLIARRRPSLVTFDEIQAHLWPGVSVTPDSRNRALSQARHAVGDDGGSQRVIATVRGQGLRFVAHAESISEPPPALPLPPAVGDDAPFVGREPVLTALQSQLAHAFEGRGRVVLLTGEAGIGKTRVAGEIGELARQRGFAVHWGRCAPAHSDPGPFWPWRQLLQGLVRGTPSDDAPDAWQTAIEDLSDVMREASDESGAAGARPLARVRSRLVEAAYAVLSFASERTPRVLILDDLQWADPDSLAVLQTTLPLIADHSVVLIVVWRDEDASPGVQRVCRNARRVAHEEIRLTGIERDDVARLLEQASGARPPPALVQAIHRKSDGNPFFVTEMIRVLLDRTRGGPADLSGVDDVEIPSTLAEVLAERLAPRSAECLSLLEFASLVGRSAELDVLASATGREPDALDEALQEALDAGLLRQDREQPGRVEFSHWLLMSHLREKSRRRTDWHWAIAEALEAHHGTRAERWGEIAYHRCRGARAGDPGKALAAARRAATHATDLLAYAEAVRYLEHAVDIGHDALDDRSRAELLLDLGRAQLRAGQREDARRSFDEAGAIARRSAATDLLARSALGFSGLPSTVIGDHKAQLERVVEALGRLDEGDRSLRARLLGRLASLRAALGDTGAAEGLAQQAVRLAGTLEDPATIASALRARNAVLVGDPLRSEERLGYADECLAFAERTGDESLQVDARLHRAVAHLHAGHAEAFHREMASLRSAARGLRHPLVEYYAELALVTSAVLSGRLEDAEHFANAALEKGRRAEHPDAPLHHLVQVVQLRFLQGRMAETIDALERVAARTDLFGVHAMRALAGAEQGDLRETRGRVGRLLDAFSEGPRDPGWLSNLSLLALATRRTRDAEAAERISLLMEPFAHRTVTVFIVVCNGSASHFLGLLAAVRERHAEARAHFDAARRANASMGALPWKVHATLGLAGSLGTGQGEGSRTRALELARAARGDAAALGMPRLEEDARALLAALEVDGHTVDPSEV